MGQTSDLVMNPPKVVCSAGTWFCKALSRAVAGSEGVKNLSAVVFWGGWRAPTTCRSQKKGVCAFSRSVNLSLLSKSGFPVGRTVIVRSSLAIADEEKPPAIKAYSAGMADFTGRIRPWSR